MVPSVVAGLLALAVLLAATGLAFPPSASAVEPGPTEAFGARAAFDAARRSGRAVEILSKESATTRVWANPNGRSTAEIYAVPVRLKRNGRWVDFDMTLVRRADGTVAPRVHPGDLVLAAAGAGGERDLATVLVGGERFGLGWSGRLPTPVLAGARATYPEALPGVDLVIEATAAGFEQFFVVKERAAASRVAALTLPMRGGFRSGAAEAGEWRAKDGRLVARMPAPLMWDAQGRGPDGEYRRKSRLRITGRASAASLNADVAWLQDPATKYPVTVDPGIVVDRGAGFDEFTQNTISISDNQGSTELKLGYSDSSDCLNESSQGCRARSYLRFDGLAGYRGAKIYSAELKLWESHAWSCTAFGWRATRTDGVSGSVQWGNEPEWREFGPVTTATTGYEAGGCGDGWVGTNVAPILDDSFANGWDSASMVLHADGDNSRTGWSTLSHNSWKKFESNEAAHKPYIHLEYDHIPALSEVKLNGDGSCGSGAGLRKYLPPGELRPTFTAKVTDDDKAPSPSFNVKLEVQATPVGGGSTLNGVTPAVAPNGGAVSVQLSAPLDSTKVYEYRLRAFDLDGSGNPMEYTAWSPPCELGFDSATLGSPPGVEGIPTIDVDGESYNIMNHGQPVTVTLRPGAGNEGKVAAYRYGFSQTTVESSNAPTVAAGPDGSAVVPLTRWQVDGDGNPTTDSVLYVRAVTVTASGFSTAVMSVWQDPEAPVPAATHIQGDVNGDGAADLAGFRALSPTEGLYYSHYGANNGTLLDPVQLLRAPYGSGNAKVAQGDFTGDGKTDFAAFVADGANDVVVKALPSDGNGLRETEVWSSKAAGAAYTGKWSLTAMRVLAGDANADGKDDLVVAYRYGAADWRLHVFAGTVVSGQLDFTDPVAWTGVIQSDLNVIKLTIGLFDNKPGADVAEFQDIGSCRTRLYLHESLTNAGVPTNQFDGGHLVWDSANTSAWCWSSSQFYGGNYGGTQSGIVATYDFGGCTTGIYTFSTLWYYDPPSALLPTPHWYPHIQQWGSPGGTQYWCASSMEPAIRDITGDGKGDLVVAYLCCGGYQQRTWVFPATGPPVVRTPGGGIPPTPGTYTAGTGVFPAPTLTKQSAVGPIGVGTVSYNSTDPYQLVAKHSGKCVAIFDGTDGGSTVESATVKQQTCASGLLNAQFRLEQRGAAYVRLHPAHDTAKCLNVQGAVTTNTAPIIQSTCTPGQSNESWQIEYVTGLSTTPGDPNERAVRLVTNLSGKCLDVRSVDTADGAVLQQYDCLAAQPNQIFYLRRVPSTTNGLLARWPIGSAQSGDRVLADSTGRGAQASIVGTSVNQDASVYHSYPDGYARTIGPVAETSKSFTVSGWVKLTALGSTHQTVVCQRASVYCAFYLRYNPDGKWHFELLNNINGGSYTISSVVSSGAAVAGTWVHLVGVYDAATSQGRLYVNGTLAGSASVSSVGASGPVIIGAAWSGATWQDRLTGDIDQIQLWERPLTSTEITDLFTAGR